MSIVATNRTVSILNVGRDSNNFFKALSKQRTEKNPLNFEAVEVSLHATIEE